MIKLQKFSSELFDNLKTFAKINGIDERYCESFVNNNITTNSVKLVLIPLYINVLNVVNSNCDFLKEYVKQVLRIKDGERRKYYEKVGVLVTNLYDLVNFGSTRPEYDKLSVSSLNRMFNVSDCLVNTKSVYGMYKSGSIDIMLLLEIKSDWRTHVSLMTERFLAFNPTDTDMDIDGNSFSTYYIGFKGAFEVYACNKGSQEFSEQLHDAIGGLDAEFAFNDNGLSHYEEEIGKLVEANEKLKKENETLNYEVEKLSAEYERLKKIEKAYIEHIKSCDDHCVGCVNENNPTTKCLNCTMKNYSNYQRKGESQTQGDGDYKRKSEPQTQNDGDERLKKVFSEIDRLIDSNCFVQSLFGKEEIEKFKSKLKEDIVEGRLTYGGIGKSIYDLFGHNFA